MKIAIIGNGISGITAARWIRKLSDHSIDVISSESDYFFSRTALMYIYMGHMRLKDTQPYEEYFWEKNRINLINEHVSRIDFESKKLEFKSGGEHAYDKLILALGSASNKFGWPGQDLKAVHGLYSLQDLELMEKYSEGLEKAVVVGGGLIGIEMAEMFHSRKIPVTMLVRESSYWNNVLPQDEAEIISQHILDHNIDLRLGGNLEAILDDGTGKVGAVKVKETGERIECGFVGLTAGVHPNVAFLKDSILEIDKGIVVDEYLKTNMEDVYAIGDCAQLASPNPGRRSIEAVWYTGRMMGETVAHSICNNPQKYDPGIWFNSAKFLDIEYQVYGDVPPELPEATQSLFWKSEDNQHSIRLNYHAINKNLTGVNLLGIRFRQEVCEKWIREKTHIEDVLKDICLADFNPEFFRTYEQSLLQQYNHQTGQGIELRSKRSLNQVISFLKS
ncbi:MAG: NAD(P)/FAD-dependent oxidoreductase [Saprospiraceae bacterium]|nr:NAD(P)/FAD-dependent oxidoreductase [Saprospiraceae bacterium]